MKWINNRKNEIRKFLRKINVIAKYKKLLLHFPKIIIAFPKILQKN